MAFVGPIDIPRDFNTLYRSIGVGGAGLGDEAANFGGCAAAGDAREMEEPIIRGRRSLDGCLIC